jgi:DNA repair exonuclease SbcCD nuclease subunit
MREEVDLVVHSGDLFDRSQPPLHTVAWAAEQLAKVARRVPTIVVAGNHDRRGLKRYLPFGAPGLTVVDQNARISVGGAVLGVVAYVKSAASWAWHAQQAVGDHADLLVAHQAFHGVVVPPGFRFRVDRQRDTVGEAHLPQAGLKAVLCGHIHPRQVVEVGGIPVVHPGATERTAFSEANTKKGYAIWELGSGVSWRFVDLPTREMIVVRSPADLGQVKPGVLVRTQRNDLAEEAHGLGGWVAKRPDWLPSMRAAPKRTPQLALFG